MAQTYIGDAKEKEMSAEAAAEQERAKLLANEDDILGALMEAAGYENDLEPIEIKRGGKTLFTFRIHPLSEEQYVECKRRNTKYVRNRNMGVKMAEEVDSARFRSCLIYEATTPEDRAKYWDNKAAWKKLVVLNGPDLISKVLKAGEKDSICDKLDQISGYTANEVETIKN